MKMSAGVYIKVEKQVLSVNLLTYFVRSDKKSDMMCVVDLY